MKHYYSDLAKLLEFAWKFWFFLRNFIVTTKEEIKQFFCYENFYKKLDLVIVKYCIVIL